jgi:pimeloyl-ACP methyl ester carboxylesterase
LRKFAHTGVVRRLASRAVRRMACLLVGVSAATGAFAQGQLGIVVLHGKQGNPAGEVLEPAISAIRSAGFLVDAPEMPWSGRRIYDATFTQALSEIDQAADRLRNAGATKIIVAGMSMGGPAVFGYAATRKVDGVVAWAPAHDPVNDPAMRSPRFLEAVAKAQQLIASGKGDDLESFPEINRDIFTVRATPKVWLSYWDPEGSNSMPRNARAFPSSIPVLIVVTTRDPFPQDEEYLLRKTPAHALSELIKVSVPHLQVPKAASEQTVAWLRKVQTVKP